MSEMPVEVKEEEQYILGDCMEQDVAFSPGEAAVIYELRKINQRLETIENLLFGKAPTSNRVPDKPRILPLKSPQDVMNFNSIDDASFNEVVRYLTHIGGCNVREAVNLCFKELMSDTCASYFTWWGKDTGHKPQKFPLHDTKIVRAVQDAVSSSTRFAAPTRVQFESNMREVLRVAKQRKRNSIRRGTTGPQLSTTTIDDEDDSK